MTGNAAHHNDAAPAPCLHAWVAHLAQFKRRFHVYAHDLVEGRRIAVERGAVNGVGRCVIDQNVDAAVYVDGFIDQLPELLHVAGVGRNAGGVSALRPDVVGELVERFLSAAADNDFGTEAGKEPGNVFADAFAGSGNNGDLASKVENGFLGG